MDSTNLFLTVIMVIGSLFGILLLVKMLKTSKSHKPASNTKISWAIEGKVEKSEVVIFVHTNNRRGNGKPKDFIEGTFTFESQYNEICV